MDRLVWFNWINSGIGFGIFSMNPILQILLIAVGLVSLCYAIAISIDHDKAEIDIKGHIVSHAKNWILMKIPLSILPMASFAIASNFKWLWAITSSTILVAAIFWTFFDGFLAKRLGFGFWYISTYSTTDEFLKPKPIWLRATIKILFILISTYFYIQGVL